MKIRSLAAAAGTLVLASTAFAAPAMAQTDDAPPAWQCEALDSFLTDQDLYEDDHELFRTTESELEENVAEFGEAAIGELLLALPFLETGNDRVAANTASFALDCDLVKEDPVFSSSNIFGSLENLSV